MLISFSYPRGITAVPRKTVPQAFFMLPTSRLNMNTVKHWTNLRSILVLLFLCTTAIPGHARTRTCDICGREIHEKYYTQDDLALGGRHTICSICFDLPTRCFACGMPVKDDYKTLPDGRYLCARDAKEAVDSDEEARKICEETRDELNRTFSRFMTFPSDNVTITIVDKSRLEGLFGSGYTRCVSLYGATKSHLDGKGKWVHSVNVLGNLRRSRLIAVCAHEFTHTWLDENLKQPRSRTLDTKAAEALCELMAYKMMESHKETFEMSTIRSNDYTKGQFEAVLEAENQYGINTVLEWIGSGEDGNLDLANLDRVRVVNIPKATPAGTAALPAPVIPVVHAAAPEKLLLKGISGTSAHPFALINDSTFEAMEKGKVRLGQTSITLRCLEIRANSVVIQIEGSNEKQELFLTKNEPRGQHPRPVETN
jgi:DNA-directed RNA polymerase subunit N (RpoN/RPB10)